MIDETNGLAESEAVFSADKLARIQVALSGVAQLAETGIESAGDQSSILLAAKARRIATALEVVGDNYLQLQESALADTESNEDNVIPLTNEQKQLVVTNIDLVKVVVIGMAASLPSYIDRDELASAGIFGLIDAATKFDETRGTAFDAYGEWRVRGAVLDHMRSMDWAPRSTRHLARQVEAAHQKLGVRYDRTPTDREVAEEVGIPTQSVVKLKDNVHRGAIISLELEISNQGDDTGTSLTYLMADPKEIDPLEQLEQRELVAYVKDALALLPERLRIVFEGYYLEGRAMSEIGDQLGVSESRISQLRAEATEKVQHAVKAQYDDTPLPTEGMHKLGKVKRRQAQYASELAQKSNWKSRIS
jgi:RNA polymerase sigma factor for flagellar operon FliA